MATLRVIKAGMRGETIYSTDNVRGTQRGTVFMLSLYGQDRRNVVAFSRNKYSASGEYVSGISIRGVVMPDGSIEWDRHPNEKSWRNRRLANILRSYGHIIDALIELSSQDLRQGAYEVDI